MSVSLLMGCLKDEGILDPKAPENIPALARFHGRAYNEGDTTLPSNRLLELSHPTIALVYHYLGDRENIRTATASVVASSPPFDFHIEMKQAPPPEIQNDDEVAVGLFWLFSDRNHNGQFDRGTHPEYAKKLHEIDSLTQLYYQKNDSLLSLSEVRAEGVAVEETTLVGAQGLTQIRAGNQLDTVWPALAGFSEKATDGPFARREVLLDQNKWERFFDNRKRSNSLSYSVVANPDYSLEMILRYSRRLFPKKGLEKRFNQIVTEVGLLSNQRKVLASRYQFEAFVKGWLDYPFNGYLEPGADWGAGRSRDHFMFFFPTWKSIETMRLAEQSSSFKIADMDKIVPGYNLMECNDQYECRRLEDNAEIKIYLGKSELYFNPPSVIRPFTTSTQNSGEDSTPLQQGMDLEGVYSFQPGAEFRFQKVGDAFWLEAGPFGVTQVKMVDSLRGVGLGLAMQIQFVPAQAKKGEDRSKKQTPEKLILDWKSERYVAVWLSSIDAKRSEIIGRHTQVTAVDYLTSVSTSLKQPFRWFGADTLKVFEASSQSVWLSGPEFPKQKFVAVDSTTLVSELSGLELQWRRKRDQVDGEWFLISGNTPFRIPLIASDPGTSDSTLFHDWRLAYDLQGSAKDLSQDFQGKPRFSCAEDSLYFVPGDTGFFRTLPENREDQITVEGDGSFDLKIPLDSTSDTLGLVLDFCGARNAKLKGALIRILIKDSKTASWSEWVPSQWLHATSNGSMSWKAVIGLPRAQGSETSTPLQLWMRVENIAVPEGISYLALNRFRVFSQ